VPPRLNNLAQRLGRLGIAFLVLLLLYLAVSTLAPGGGFTLLVMLALYTTGALLALQFIRRNARRIIWRLRNRLIVAYLFIAFVPIVLIVILVAFGGYILAGQAAVYLVGSELDRRTAALNGAAQLIAAAPESNRSSVVREVMPYVQARFPRPELLVRDGSEHRYPENASVSPPPAEWKDTSGIVNQHGRFYAWAHVAKPGVDVTLLAPLTTDFLSELVPDLGEVFLLDFSGDSPRLMAPSGRAATKNTGAREGRIRPKDRVPPPKNRFDLDFPWVMPLGIPTWDTPGSAYRAAMVVHTRPSAVLSTIFGQKLEVSQFVLAGFLLVAGLLLLVWLVSLITGVSMTRTITGAVHNLYEGTQRVKEGDFSHRIEVHGNDQLGELGRSFNVMTENLERLIVVEKEQERLKSEIAIAREVQGQLFPRDAPVMKTIELMGVCHPARMVSGDYYDFVRLRDANVALAIGDVAGKGISAALLMAALQSIMRTQLTAGISAHAAASPGGGGSGGHAALSARDLVSQLNKQVYANTSPEKYATFYFGLYDDDTRLLTYTNAGHLPPILMREGVARHLEVTGTVVGAFPFALYEEKSVELRQGDLLVAFTDGIVEPENEYGEPFGEERLVDLLVRYGQRESKEIIARIMETVEQWTGTAELFDDMTLLLARGV
jgi:sigma-B regulation protein RsbU (phosphoserine phosphatase)